MSHKRTNNLIYNKNYQQAKLVLVGGSYKSGTSLLTATIEKKGAINPAYRTSQQIEFGHSIEGLLYPTRECKISRDLNRKIVSSTVHERDKLTPSVEAYINDMVAECGNFLVIKDPYFKFTAGFWAVSAKKLGINVELNLTNRQQIDIFSGWHCSRFLSWQLKKNPSLFSWMTQPIQQETMMLIMGTATPINIFYYDALVKQFGSKFALVPK